MQSETLAQEFARLVKEYHEGDDHTKPEAWNLLADYAVDNADAITAALSEKQAAEVAIRPLEWRDVDGDIVNLIALARTPFDIYFIERDSEGYVLKLGSTGLLPHPTFEAAKAAAQADYEQRIKSALVDVPVEPVVDWIGTVACPCTTFEQDEDCPVGYPSLMCGACSGKGVVQSETVISLAAEMLKVAEQVDELEDPFAAWETIELLKSDKERLTKINADHCDTVNTYIGRVSRLEDELEAIRAHPPLSHRGEDSAAPVQDTWFTDRALPVMAMSADVESNRILKLHFRRPVTDDDRKALCDALNMHQAALAATRSGSASATTAKGCAE